MILKDFNETFAPRLRDPEYLGAYLKACLEEDLPTFYVGLRKAVQVRENGFSWLAHQTGMGRESLYKALSAKGNPSFKTIYRVLLALGVETCLLTPIPGTVRSPHIVQSAKRNNTKSAETMHKEEQLIS